MKTVYAHIQCPKNPRKAVGKIERWQKLFHKFHIPLNTSAISTGKWKKRGYSEGEVIMTELESPWSSKIQDTLIENPKNDLIPSLYKDVNRKQSLCLHYNRYSEITQSEKKILCLDTCKDWLIYHIWSPKLSNFV